MKNLVVVAFEEQQKASQFMTELQQLQKEGLIKVDDAATIIRGQDGRVKVKQANSLVGAGALGGSFWGMLIGMLFWAPLLGMAIGGAVGAGIGKASDYGVDDEFIKEVGSKLQPGSSAAFLLISESQPDKVIDALKPFKGEIIHTSLSNEQEARLREAFAGA